MHLSKGVVWLASYPKSGNTWVRLLLANLLSNQNEPVSINDIELNGRSIVRRTTIEEATLIDTDLLTPDECLLLRARVVTSVTNEADKKEEPLFVKTHDAYCFLPDGSPLFGSTGPQKAIYIVRDPRDVAVSFSFHMNCDLDKSVYLLGDDHFFMPNIEKQLTNFLPQHLHSWSRHVTSWTAQTNITTHVIRYEDLRTDPCKVFGDAVAFLNINVSREKLEQAVRFSDFTELQAQERRHDFLERQSSAPFFRKGRVGGWIDTLNEQQSAAIIARHQDAMKRLGYL